MDNRSFTYGRILAVFDQLESYAMTVKKKEVMENLLPVLPTQIDCGLQ